MQERKSIVRAMKGHVSKIAQHEHSSIVSKEYTEPEFPFQMNVSEEGFDDELLFRCVVSELCMWFGFQQLCELGFGVYALYVGSLLRKQLARLSF